VNARSPVGSSSIRRPRIRRGTVICASGRSSAFTPAIVRALAQTASTGAPSAVLTTTGPRHG
jgi:hypothetical protein